MNAIAATKPLMLAILEPATEVPRKRFWTAPEIALLKQHYPKLGLAGCLPLFPGRSGGSIYQHAAALGLRAPGVKGQKHAAWPTSEFIDAAIKRAYQGTPYKGLVRELAIRVGRPRSWVTTRARKLGLVTPRFREDPWSAAECALLEQHAHKDARVIRNIFLKRGFARTATAIEVKRKRLQFSSIDPNKFNANSFAHVMGVDRGVILGWIEKGWLPASRDGEMWSIRRRHARQFVIESVGSYDIRKVDKFMFVDLVANARGA